jgi:hypothetical protein
MSIALLHISHIFCTCNDLCRYEVHGQIQKEGSLGCTLSQTLEALQRVTMSESVQMHSSKVMYNSDEAVLRGNEDNTHRLVFYSNDAVENIKATTERRTLELEQLLRGHSKGTPYKNNRTEIFSKELISQLQTDWLDTAPPSLVTTDAPSYPNTPAKSATDFGSETQTPEAIYTPSQLEYIASSVEPPSVVSRSLVRTPSRTPTTTPRSKRRSAGF